MTSGPESLPEAATGLENWMQAHARRIDAVLTGVLPQDGPEPHDLHRAMRYAALGGGKRMRPLLVYAAGELSGAHPDILDAAAAAVELIHAYSLVHDDLPCMDDDDLRRGRPTVHRAYGEAMALLAGDALQALAFEVLAGALARQRPGGAAPAADMLLELAFAAGAHGMAGGQAHDLGATGQRLERAALEQMHRMKTGALLEVSLRLGLLAGGLPDPEQDQAIRTCGPALGLAFQIVDDILDDTADTHTLGKTAGKDRAQDKPTYVSVLGLDEARRLADIQRRLALSALEPLGARAQRLRQLADRIVFRTH